MSLADELLADFDDESDGEENQEHSLQDSLNTTLDLYSNKAGKSKTRGSGGDGMVLDGDEEAEDEDEDMGPTYHTVEEPTPVIKG